MDAGCTFALARLDGAVFATAVDKRAPSAGTHLANTARCASVGRAKSRSPIHALTRIRTRPDEMFRLTAAPHFKVKTTFTRLREVTFLLRRSR
ncbi:hypothetical protein AEM42_13140 [Betaproteobacteria bacterium UKL13-2]|nr:hypothetical protein AEM42_13140 [Betaproteobacteria bacterium UKL13-2]HCG53077.1 hypothetical protein [Betaproteobacteria bacterium]